MFTIHDKVPYDPNLIGLGSIPEEYRQVYEKLQDVIVAHAAAINGSDVWEDLESAIVPNGIGTAAVYDGTTYPGTLLFNGTADRYVSGVVRLPHSWKEGTSILPYIRWTKTGADPGGSAVSWEMRWAGGSVGSQILSLVSWTAGTLAYGNLTTTEVHNDTVFPALVLTGKTISTVIHWELRRLGSTDAYNSNTRLLGVGFKYIRNTSGSRREYTK